jgi:hypothetical protein
MQVLSSPPVPAATPFHLNEVEAAGQITRLWTWNDGLFARLRVPGPQPAREPTHLTLRLPDPAAHPLPLTLTAGADLQVSGYLADVPYQESGAQFLKKLPRAQQQGLPTWLKDVQVARIATHVIVTALTQTPQAPYTNQARLDGVIATQWSRHGVRYVRLAIYDEHTPLLPQDPTRRKAHFVSVQFPTGFACRVGQRVRVAGGLFEKTYRQSLAAFLAKSQPKRTLPATLAAEQLTRAQGATYLRAQQVVGF